MGVLSKLSKDYTCYELGHPWNISCLKATIFTGFIGSQQCFKTYFLLYLLSALFSRKSLPYYLKNFLPETLRSTAFLTTNGIAFMSAFCIWRKISDFNYLSVGFLPSLWAATAAILIESQPRRRLLAVYMSSIAAETLYKMAKFRGWIKPLPYGETVLFCFVLSGLMYLLKINRCGKTVSGLLHYLIGKDETDVVPSCGEGGDRHRRRHAYDHKSNQSHQNTWLSDWLQKALNSFHLKKSSLCQHSHSCVHYVLEAPIKPFATGVGIQALLTTPTVLKFLFRRAYSQAFKSIFRFKNLSLAAFLSSLAMIFKFSQCLLRRKIGQNAPWQAAVSGLLSGLSMLCYRSSSITLYLASKLCENICVQAHAAGFIPYVPGFDILLYALATSIVFHAVLVEPHNIRPSYYKFIDKCSNGMFSKINRRLLDEFGTQSSLMMPDYWPEYDPAYSQLKESDYPIALK